MIENILIKNVASYDNTGTQLDDLKKINFIYGANGSGKTIISNLLSGQADLEFKDCNLQWRHGQVLNSLVYNKKFREQNFGTGEIQGVFTLGEATKEEQILIEAKQIELGKLSDDHFTKKAILVKKENTKSAEETSFKENVWEKIYKKHEGEFKKAFQGSMRKESFTKRLLLEFKTNTSPLQAFDDLKKNAKTIFGKAPEAIESINIVNFDKILTIETDNIWGDKIIGKSDVDISRLIQKLNINDWVNQGRSYIQQDGLTCPFCQQPTIADNFKKKLESYFDESFTTSINQINEFVDEYKWFTDNLINELTQIETSQKVNIETSQKVNIETSQKVNNETKLDIDKFSAYLKTLLSQISENKVLLNGKTKEPSRSIILTSTKEQFENIKKLIKSANEEIERHNNIVNNYKKEKHELIKAIWMYLIENNKVDIKAYNKKISGLDKRIKALDEYVNGKRNPYKILDEEIKKLTTNVTSIQPTIDEINNTLKCYGFDNFEIVPSASSENHYQIKREDGEPAELTLSEGEITFITFLYYLQLVKGSTDKETVIGERILVIDDPISSLDSNVLFVVSTLIKGIIEEITKKNNNPSNIKQLILLTHNVYFHKEVSFINGKAKKNYPISYWILRKNNNMSSAQPFYKENPIHTSYELLWNEIKNRKYNSNVTIQNTMRRIIESYFKLVGGYNSADLSNKFPSKEGQGIFRSLISWMHDGSHNSILGDEVFIEAQTNAVDKYLKIFKEIFILTGHKEHYDMMMGIENAANN